MSQPAHLDQNIFKEEVYFEMTSFRDHSRICRKSSSVIILDSFPSSELDNKLSDQFTGSLRSNFPITITSDTIALVPKFIEKDLQ